MFIAELSRHMVLTVTELRPIILQQTLTVNITGFALLFAIIALGGYIGYQRGVRASVGLALGTIIAYLLTVQGGNDVVNFINRFYTNMPKLVAFALGRDPDTAPTLDPLIAPDVPLFFRFVLFFALFVFFWFLNKRWWWYGASPANYEPLARPLGLLSGALSALLLSNAAAVFWDQSGNGLNIPVLTPVLNILPDISPVIPSLITIYFIVLGVTLLFIFPRLLKVPPAPQKK